MDLEDARIAEDPATVDCPLANLRKARTCSAGIEGTQAVLWLLSDSEAQAVHHWGAPGVPARC